MEGYLVVTSIQAALLTVGLLSVSITLLHRAIQGVNITPQRIEVVTRQARYRLVHPPDLCRLRHLSPQTSPGALLLMASQQCQPQHRESPSVRNSHRAPISPLDGEIWQQSASQCAYMPVHSRLAWSKDRLVWLDPNVSVPFQGFAAKAEHPS